VGESSYAVVMGFLKSPRGSLWGVRGSLRGVRDSLRGARQRDNSVLISD
jgi:hypothetical protein